MAEKKRFEKTTDTRTGKPADWIWLSSVLRPANTV